MDSRNYYLDLNICNFNNFIAKLERDGIVFSICKQSAILQDNCKRFSDKVYMRSFDGHELMQKCFYNKQMYNACLTFTNYNNYHRCNQQPIMVGSDLDRKMLDSYGIKPDPTYLALRGVFYSGTTAYRMPLLLSNNREIPHSSLQRHQLFYYYIETGESIKITCESGALTFRTHTGHDYVNDLSKYTNDSIFGNHHHLFDMQSSTVFRAICDWAKENKEIDHFANKIIADHVYIFYKMIVTIRSIVSVMYKLPVTDPKYKIQMSRLNQVDKILKAGDWFKFISKRNAYTGNYAMSERNSRSNRESQLTNAAFFSNVLRPEPCSHNNENPTRTHAIPTNTAFILDPVYNKSTINSFMREYALASNIHIINVNDPPVNWPELLLLLWNRGTIFKWVDMSPSERVGAKQLVIQSFHATIFWVRSYNDFRRIYNYVKLKKKMKVMINETRECVYMGMYQSQPGKMINGCFFPLLELERNYFGLADTISSGGGGDGNSAAAAVIQRRRRANLNLFESKDVYKHLFGAHTQYLLDSRLDQYSPIERFSVATNYLATSVALNENEKASIVSDTLVQNVYYQVQPSENTVAHKKGAGYLQFRTQYINDPRISLDGYLMRQSIANKQLIDYHYRFRFSFNTRATHIRVLSQGCKIPLIEWGSFLYASLFTVQTLVHPINYFINNNLKLFERCYNTGSKGANGTHFNRAYEYFVFFLMADPELININRSNQICLVLDINRNQQNMKKTWLFDGHLRLDQRLPTGFKVTNINGEKGLIHVMHDAAYLTNYYDKSNEYNFFGPITSLVGRQAFASLRNTILNNGKENGCDGGGGAKTSFLPIFNFLTSFYKSGNNKFCNYMTNSLINSNAFLTVKRCQSRAHASDELLPDVNLKILAEYLLSKTDIVLKEEDITHMQSQQTSSSSKQQQNVDKCLKAAAAEDQQQLKKYIFKTSVLRKLLDRNMNKSVYVCLQSMEMEKTKNLKGGKKIKRFNGVRTKKQVV